MHKQTVKTVQAYLETLKHANGTIEKAIKKNVGGEDLATALQEMQELAITAGNTIEETEGEGTQAVHHLEAYCETLYQIDAALQGESAEDRYRLTKLAAKLKTQTAKVEEELIITGDDGRYEVVFLPYSASMWDCMETVWRAALEDPDADVYVVPIPYYDKNEDGSLGKRQYEADLFPPYVPITSYDDYDIKLRRPAYAFLHNPYDEYNTVTSVDPAYYCRVLKDCVDTLVYIPYYAYSSPYARLSDAHRLLPAYVYCDKIIMQTEQLKNDIDNSVPREKILVAGSPKAERMALMELHKDEIDLPPGWKEIIDGKKVIFYNTTINTILNDKEKRLDKIEEIFDQVQKFDNLVLLWRPHPLIPATIDSMLPELKARYRALQLRFEREFAATGKGILDMTGDPERAAAISDCYIGDEGSSVIELFRFVEKPRFFTRWETFYNPTQEELSAERTFGMCEVGEEIYFVSFPSHHLCRLTLATGEISVIAPLPEAAADNIQHYSDIVHLDGKLYFQPYHADALLIYDLKTGVFSKKYFKEAYVMYAFARCFVYDGAVWLTPMDYPAIVKYDPATEAFTYYDAPVAEMLAKAGADRIANPFEWGWALAGHVFYLTTRWSNAVLEFDLMTGRHIVHSVGDPANRYRNIVIDGDEVYLDDWNRLQIVCWNRKSGAVTLFKEFPEEVRLWRIPNAPSVPFRSMIDLGDRILLIPVHASRFLSFDKASGEITCPFAPMPDEREEKASVHFGRYDTTMIDYAKRLSDGRILCVSPYDFSILVLDPLGGVTARIPIRIPDLLAREVRSVSFNLHEFWESLYWPIGKYLTLLSRDLLHRPAGTWRPVLSTMLGDGKKLYEMVIGNKKS